METTLMYLTGNDSRLAEDLISALSAFSSPSSQQKRRVTLKQNLSIPSKERAEHQNREALVHVRQSTMAQVRFNQESTQRQYALQERALSLGWPEEHIRVIDGDLGISGSGRSKHPGFPLFSPCSF